jgi:hypothetical protein
VVALMLRHCWRDELRSWNYLIGPWRRHALDSEERHEASSIVEPRHHGEVPQAPR